MFVSRQPNHSEANANRSQPPTHYHTTHLIPHTSQTQKYPQSHEHSIQSDIPFMVYLSQFVTNWIENLERELDRLVCLWHGLNPCCIRLRMNREAATNWLENNFNSPTLNQFPRVVSIELTNTTYR